MTVTSTFETRPSLLSQEFASDIRRGVRGCLRRSSSGCVQLTADLGCWGSVGRGEPALEGDLEGVEWYLPAHRPERVVLDAFGAAAASWREALEDLDEDVLAEAVDELVRGLLGQLADWQQSISELGRVLTTATERRPLPG
jgi:hypothetical protein